MELSEIEAIAKLAAQETLVRIGRYTVEYREPETVAIGLSESMSEESTAADWYRRRAANARSKGDEEAAKLYEHVAKEEDGHYREFEKKLGIRKLGPRELEVLKLAAKGRANKEIASALDITEQTVKNHLSNIYQKLNVTSRTQAIAFGIYEGWLSPEAAHA